MYVYSLRYCATLITPSDLLWEINKQNSHAHCVFKLRIYINNRCDFPFQDVFNELLVPLHTVDANRTTGVVYYSLCKSVNPYIKNRPGLLLKSSLVPEETARALTDHGYKFLSTFGYTCPVQVHKYTISSLFTYTRM